MITTEHILAAFRLLERSGIRRGDGLRVSAQGPDEPTEAYRDRQRARIVEVAEAYAATLADVSVEGLEAAVLAMMQRPKPWWPSAGELRDMVPGRPTGLVLLDPDEQAWERILAVLRKGPQAPEAQAGVSFREVTRTEEIRGWNPAEQREVVKSRSVTRTEVVRTASPLEQSLTAEQLGAFRQIGQLGGLLRAEADASDPAITRGALRKRFLVLCRTPAQALEAGPAALGLPMEGAPAALRGFLGSGADPHAVQRQAAIELARRDN